MAETENSPTAGKRSTRAAVLLTILVAGAILRFLGLGYQSFWYDETQVRMLAYLPRVKLFQAVAPYQNAPPLYFAFIQAWMKAFGRSEFSMRLPSAAFGIISIALIYCLAKQLARKSGRLGFIAGAAAALLALSRFHIAYCQEARPYSMVFMLALISCCAFVKLLEDRRARWQWIYALATICMFWTHPYSLWVFVTQWCFLGICAVFQHNRSGFSIRRQVGILALVALTFCPWLQTAQNMMHGTTVWMPRPTWSNVAPSFVGTGIACVFSFGLLALSLVRFVRTRELAIIFAWLLASLPIAVPILMSQGRFPFFVPRYGLWAIGGLYIAMAFGLAAVPGRLAALVLLTFLAVQCPPILVDFRERLNMQVKPDVRAAADFIQRSAEPGDRFYCASDLLGLTLQDYLRGTNVAELDKFNDAGALSQVKRIWLLDSRDSNSAAQQRDFAQSEFKASPFEIRNQWQYRGLSLFELIRKNDPKLLP